MLQFQCSDFVNGQSGVAMGLDQHSPVGH